VLDLHCHILPEVDDGAESMDEALAMARFFVRDGVTHVVATPHCHRHIKTLRADVLPRVARLNAEIGAAGIPLTILPGAEIQVTDSTEYRSEFDAGLYCHLGDSREFTLLEFSWNGSQYPADAADLITWIRSRGMTPIVAHPERHGYFLTDPARLRAVVDAGAWIQITVDSLLGNFGQAARAAGEALLQEYPDAVLADDAHNLQRCSGLSAGYAWVEKRLGAERAGDLKARADWVLTALLRSGE
jgi:protein-tyrosine phosphatase